MPDKNWKDNHMFVSLSMMILVGAGLTTIGTVSGMYDAAHTSAAELKIVQNKVDATELSSKCRALSIQISLADSAIWQMEQSANPGRRLTEKKRELRKLQSQYDDAHCASVLAKG
jgi:hypothetical protein